MANGAGAFDRKLQMKECREILIACLMPLMAVSVASGTDRVAWMLQTNGLGKAEAQVRAGLPNVLVLGDSISIGYTPFLRKRLEGVANVCRPPCNCGATQFYFRERNGLKDWLGTNRWDVITVNCGIWDFCYMRGDPVGTDHFWGDQTLEALPPLQRGTAIRARGFRVRTPIPAYMANLRRILTDLKATGATVVFALTTPVPAYQDDDRCGLARAYNEVAESVCRELDVRTVDLYSVGERNYANQPDRCHYNDAGNDALAESLAGTVSESLGKPRD